MRTTRTAVAFTVGSVVVWALVLQPWHWYMGDLVVYRGGGSALLHGKALYAVVSGRDHLHFTYPPFAAAVVAPMAVVSVGTARAVSLLVSLAAVYASVLIAARAVVAESRPLATGFAPVAFAIVIWFEPVRATMSFGQINALLMLAILADLLLLRDSKWCGVLLGLSAAIKLTPLAFIVYLLMVRRWRAAATAVATFVVAGLVGWVCDPAASRTYWGDHRFLSAHRIGRVENVSNQSVRGVLARLLRTVDVPVWWLVIAAAVFLGCLFVAYLLHQAGNELAALMAVAVGMLCASPVSWSHHWVWCAPMAVAGYDVVRRSRRRSVASAVGVALLPFAAGMVFWVPQTYHRELSDSFLQELVSATYVIAGLLLVIGFALVAGRSGRPARWSDRDASLGRGTPALSRTDPTGHRTPAVGR